MAHTSLLSKKWFLILTIWGISFGGIVGWSSFVMPGTMFLPVAGPVGSLIALLISGAIIMMIAANFHNMMNRRGASSKSGGVFSYTKEIFGYDYSLMCVWPILLAYISIMWTNASAFTLFSRYLFGSTFQWGFCYSFAGYDVWAGEIIVTIIITVLCGILCSKCSHLVRYLQTALALVLFLGVALCFILVIIKSKASVNTFVPVFASPEDGAFSPMNQVLNIVALAPWIFIGFCVVSLLPGKSEFSDGSFPLKKSFAIMAVAILCGTFTYIFLVLLAPCSLPENCSSWRDYINNLSDYKGLSAIPTFNTVRNLLGSPGVVLLAVCATSAMLTGIICMYRAAAQLLQSLADDDVLPEWFGVIGKNGLPQNATFFIMFISLVIPFFGRTATGWIVDVTTITAAISYAFVSAASFVVAKREKNIPFMITGVIGIISSIFCCSPIISTSVNPLSLSKEAYLILAFWALVGLLLFHAVFMRDKKNRFGTSTVMWVAMLFIVLISSIMWQRQTTYEKTEDVIKNVSIYHSKTHDEEGIPMTKSQIEREQNYMEEQMNVVRSSQFINSLIMFGLILISLFVMLNIFVIQKKREQKLSLEKAHAEASNKAKSTFLSNMSHDIRTPMNAIVGFTNLALKSPDDINKTTDYLEKIKASSEHLLSLINDVLEMSRVESGKMELQEAPCSLKAILNDLHTIIIGQVKAKQQELNIEHSNVKDDNIVCDKLRLNQILLNLLSNATKYTPNGGHIAVKVEQERKENDIGFYKFSVKDDGIGMSPEFASRVFESFEREKKSTVSGIQGTGLGMAITKSLVELMGGEISVKTKEGSGTEFTIEISFKIQENDTNTVNAVGVEVEEATTNNFTGKRLLLVDDIEINREIACAILESLGFTVEQATDGSEAVKKVQEADSGYYDAVLMDIQMPTMNGYDATRAIRALEGENSKVPIIAMTANAFEEDKKAALAAGMNAHIAKPINEEQLSLTLSKYV